MHTLWQDLRFAFSGFVNRAGFTALAVITLGLGIAANTAVFSWIDAVLLSPLPGISTPNELAALESVGADGARLGQLPHPDFRDFQSQMTLASGVVATHTGFFTIGPDAQPYRVLGQVVSANFFSVLGAEPFLGRMLLPEEDRDVEGAYPNVVISHRLWRTYFHSDPAVVGRSVRVNGRMFTLVGVARPDFAGTFGGAMLDVWTPLSMITRTGMLNTWAASDRNARFLDVIVRLKPGVRVEQAREEARAVAARLAAAYPDTHKGIGASIVPMSQALYGLQSTLGNPLRILMAVCILVLLIACANVANLLMARSVSRQREFGIRIALGASRMQLARQLLTEVMALALAGALVGVLLSQWLNSAFAYALPALDSPLRGAVAPLLHPKLSGTVLLFTALAAIGAAVISTLMPALYTMRLDPHETLKRVGGRGVSGSRANRIRGALVIAEVSLAAMALIGAGQAVLTFQRLANLRLGFDVNNVLIAHFHLSTNGYSLDKEKQFDRTLRARLQADRGIEDVTYADSVPLSMFTASTDRVQALGSEAGERGVIALPRSIVSPGYFRTMRIPLIHGRDFTEQDDRKSPLVIIVTQAFVDRYFEGRNAIGRRLRVSGNWSTVVGVVKDSKYRRPGEGPTPYFYAPFNQAFWSGNNNFVYVRSANLNLAREILRRDVAALDGNRNLYELSTLEDYTHASLFGERIAAALLSGLAVLALVLATVGLYSVLAYTVSERTREIGIRMALGAPVVRVLGLVLRNGMGMTIAGLAVGTVAGIAAAPLVFSNGSIPGRAVEPTVLAASSVSLLITALVASLLPARRATRVDPITALRTE
jgi:predicted permease